MPGIHWLRWLFPVQVYMVSFATVPGKLLLLPSGIQYPLLRPAMKLHSQWGHGRPVLPVAGWQWQRSGTRPPGQPSRRWSGRISAAPCAQFLRYLLATPSAPFLHTCWQPSEYGFQYPAGCRYPCRVGSGTLTQIPVLRCPGHGAWYPWQTVVPSGHPDTPFQ